MKLNKILNIFLIILLLLNIFPSSVKAVDIDMNEAFIEDLGQCEMHLQYWK